MAERLSKAPEQEQTSAEALEQTRHEQLDKLAAERERKNNETEKTNVETSVAEAKEAAAKAEKKTEPVAAKLEKKRDTPAARRAKAKASYKKTMKETQAHMKPAQRSFSKVIHNPAVEKSSEVVGSTVARPNAILTGSVLAFLFTLALYVFARYYGYPLSGSETIAAFILGWVVGLLFDYLRVMITGKKV